jgi:hypothetical protein
MAQEVQRIPVSDAIAASTWPSGHRCNDGSGWSRDKGAAIKENDEVDR